MQLNRRSPYLSSALLVIGSLGLVLLARRWFAAPWHHEPFHSTIEAVGGVVAIAMASLIAWGRDLYDDGPLDTLGVGLAVQGVLDLVHAAISPGPTFFWSRALPTLLGGMIFACVWLQRRPFKGASVWAAGVASLISIALVAAPTAWPIPFDASGHYKTWAKLLNLAGGAGFLAAVVFFLRRSRQQRATADTVFAHHALLFAIAGFSFGLSSLWDGAWWTFHLLRLFAYLVSLAFLFDLLRRLSARRELHSATEMQLQLDEVAALRERLARSEQAP